MLPPFLIAVIGPHDLGVVHCVHDLGVVHCVRDLDVVHRLYHLGVNHCVHNLDVVHSFHVCFCTAVDSKISATVQVVTVTATTVTITVTVQHFNGQTKSVFTLYARALRRKYRYI